ncbi:MAG TPA: AAA family ATPase [Pyrinomonadaceae bacterium]|jgi:Archaeal adenylate kinase|nr:AAA family ATPase [Pyrinomonadaceae bacterium]
MRLIFLYGLPGVGKLTVARELAEFTGFRVFHNHLTVDLVGSVFDFGSEPFVELREMIWLEVFKRSVAANLNGLIFTFAFDRTVRGDFVQKARDVVESAGGEIFFVELCCATEELERRIEHPSRQRFGKLSSAVTFRELQSSEAFVDPGLPKNRLIVDTTTLSASDSASLIATELGLKSPK